MFGTSLSEIAVVGVVALVVVGPQKLPTMLRTLGQWTGKLRRMTMEMRAKTGIDEILREEGIDGVAELRSLLRGEIAAANTAMQRPIFDPYQDDAPVDLAAEYPPEGADSKGAIPEDLLVHARSGEASPPPATVPGGTPEPLATTEPAATEPTSTEPTTAEPPTTTEPTPAAAGTTPPPAESRGPAAETPPV